MVFDAFSQDKHLHFLKTIWKCSVVNSTLSWAHKNNVITWGFMGHFTPTFAFGFAFKKKLNLKDNDLLH